MSPRTKRKPKWKVPFTPDGSMYGDHPGLRTVRRDQRPRWEDRVEREPDYEFDATLTFLSFDWGERGAKRIWFKDVANNRYLCMFCSELKQALTLCKVTGVEFEGRWGFRKQGQEYSIVAVKKDIP